MLGFRAGTGKPRSTASSAAGPRTETPSSERIADTPFVFDLDGPRSTTAEGTIVTSARVANPRGGRETVTATYWFAGEPRSRTSITVAGRDSERVSFEYSPEGFDPATYAHGITIANDDIDYLSEPPAQFSEIYVAPKTADEVPVLWEVSELRGPTVVMGYEDVTVSVILTNRADSEADTVTTGVSVADAILTRDVTVAAGESEAVRFDFTAPQVPAADAGTRPVTAEAREARLTTTMVVGHAAPDPTPTESSGSLPLR